MTTKRFRFGVVGENATTPELPLDTARQAEQLGYSTFSLRDHFVREPFGDQLAPMVALAAVATSTRTIGVGTLVLANDYRNPVLLAKEAATLDALSGGRLELGIGAGWHRQEYEQAGIPFERGGLRVDRLDEAITVLKGMLSGAAVTQKGSHYTVVDLATYPLPGKQPPILVGAGSKQMLQLAGREADIVGILPKALPNGTISEELSERTPETMTRKIEWVREGAGDRFDDIELSMLISPILTADPKAAAEQYVTSRGWDRSIADAVPDMPSAFIGSPNEIAEQMEARRERYGFSYYVVSDGAMESFAPVVELLEGN